MIDVQKAPIGASFGEVYAVSNEELEAVIDLVTPAEAFDLIFHNNDVNVYRIFSQVTSKHILEFNLTYIAELIDKDTFLVTSGIIRTTEYIRVPEYEKIGKRILYNATKQRWNIHY